MSALLYLNDRDVRRLLDPAEVLDLTERTLRAQAAAEVTWSEPRMLSLRPAGHPARLGAKLCLLDFLGVAGFRVINGVRDAAAGRPNRLVLLNDPGSGAFLAIVELAWSNAVRTGAQVAVAVRYLGRAGTDTVGLIGAGKMARGVLYMLRQVMPLSRAVVHSPRPESRRRFADEMAEQYRLDVRPVDGAGEVMRQADTVVVCTTAPHPVVAADQVREGHFIYSMGEQQELATAIYRGVDKFVVDDWGQVRLKPDMRALLARGEFAQADVYGDLSEIVAARKPGREACEERIVCRSQGLVTLDVALAHQVYRRALAEGVGQVLAD